MFYVCKKSLEEPVVFLHGFLGSHADWSEFLPAFSHSFAFDLPGHGKSGIYSLDELYNAIPEKAHLVGYSLGGRIALRLLFSYPKKFSSLSLLSAHPGLEDMKAKEARIESDKKWAALLKTLPMEAFLKEWYNRPLFAKSPIPAYRTEQNPEFLEEVLLTYSLGKQPSYWQALEETKTPLLFLFGGEDKTFLPIYERLTKIANISTGLLEGATHSLPLEKPKESLEKIRTFIKEIKCSS
ncbi:MAG: alpha/beta fold hydrolase [Verrucomicrobia bacterium]|nr:alpha/beta fold hydrolase [Verrucomicrobiota bacterium]